MTTRLSSPWEHPLGIDLTLVSSVGRHQTQFNELSWEVLCELSHRVHDTILTGLKKQTNLSDNIKNASHDIIAAHRAATYTKEQYYLTENQFPENATQRSYENPIQCATTRYAIWITNIHVEWAKLMNLHFKEEFYKTTPEHPCKERARLRIYELLTHTAQ